MRVKLVNGERKVLNEGGIAVFVRVRMDVSEKEEFMATCRKHALNPSEVARRLIKGFVARGGWWKV